MKKVIALAGIGAFGSGLAASAADAKET